MDTYKKWEIFEDLLNPGQLFAAEILINYGGFNHETLDYLAESFEIDWDELEDED